jgi:RNA polymerase sigma factor (sigma-70 family)
MDHDALVRRASNGDVRAFVELTQRFQHFAFGSALTLLQDFQRAEDVVQEAFVAAWSALPTLDDSAAFPGWLRTIVRHHALRVLRRKQLEAVPLTAADDVPSDDALPDHRLEQRQQAAAALFAIAELPDELREPATLFFVHECSHQDIATFQTTRAKAGQVMKGWPASAPLARRAATALTRASSSIGLAATALATMHFPQRPYSRQRPSVPWRALTQADGSAMSPMSRPPLLMRERPTTGASSSIGLAATALATKKAMPFPRRPSALWRAFTPSTI